MCAPLFLPSHKLKCGWHGSFVMPYHEDNTEKQCLCSWYSNVHTHSLHTGVYITSSPPTCGFPFPLRGLCSISMTFFENLPYSFGIGTSFSTSLLWANLCLYSHFLPKYACLSWGRRGTGHVGDTVVETASGPGLAPFTRRDPVRGGWALGWMCSRRVSPIAEPGYYWHLLWASVNAQRSFQSPPG